MATSSTDPGAAKREAAGFVATAAFAGLAAVRDVYLGGLFQHASPFHFAAVAFSLCSLIFLPIAGVWHRESLRRLLAHPWPLFWVNVTTAAAWLSFFQALRTAEPSLVQVLFSGIGPVSVLYLDRLLPGAAVSSPPLGRLERLLQFGILGTLVAAAVISLTGLSAVGSRPWPIALAGVGLAVGAGLSISASMVLCRQLNDAGVAPTALVSVRFVGAAAIAIFLAPGPETAPGASLPSAWTGLIVASLVLIVLPIYVNQIGIALASPITVRVVLAATPALVFALQLVEQRLSSSPYSLGATALYGLLAVSATVARRRGIRIAAGDHRAHVATALPSPGQ